MRKNGNDLGNINIIFFLVFEALMKTFLVKILKVLTPGREVNSQMP